MPDLDGAIRRLGLPIVLLFAFILYWPGLTGPLILDDIPNIQQNVGLRFEHFDVKSLAAVIESATSLQENRNPWLNRPISYLSFAFNLHFLGESVFAMKLVNLILHLLCGGVIYFFIKKLLELAGGKTDVTGIPRQTISLLVAGLWLLHPLMVSTVLYTVQRMTILSALFTMAGCLLFLIYRQRFLIQDRGLMTGGLFVAAFTSLAFLSKENGALLPVFCSLLELVCFRFIFHLQTTMLRRYVYVGLIVVPTCLLIAYLVYQAQIYWHHEIYSRAFTEPERVLTEFRVVWRYLAWLLIPDITQYSFFHDTISVSENLLNPVSTLFAVIGVLALLVFAVWSTINKKYVLFGFVVLWFFIGHLLESTVIPLEIAFEHRNYVPAIGPLLGVVLLLTKGISRLNLREGVKWLTMASLVVVLPGAFLSERVGYWSSLQKLTDRFLTLDPKSPRAWSKQADTLLKMGQDDAALVALTKASVLASAEVGYPLAMAVVLCRQERVLPQPLVEEIQNEIRLAPFTSFGESQFLSLSSQCNHRRYDEVLSPIYLLAQTVPSIATRAYYMAALGHYRQGEYLQALNEITELIRLDPAAEEPLKLRVMIEQRLKQGSE